MNTLQVHLLYFCKKKNFYIIKNIFRFMILRSIISCDSCAYSSSSRFWLKRMNERDDALQTLVRIRRDEGRMNERKRKLPSPFLLSEEREHEGSTLCPEGEKDSLYGEKKRSKKSEVVQQIGRTGPREAQRK